MGHLAHPQSGDVELLAVKDALDQGFKLAFLADGWFIEFGDRRAAAGFWVVADLAPKTLVLHFNRSGRLLPIAKKVLAGAHDPVRLTG